MCRESQESFGRLIDVGGRNKCAYGANCLSKDDRNILKEYLLNLYNLELKKYLAEQTILLNRNNYHYGTELSSFNSF